MEKIIEQILTSTTSRLVVCNSVSDITFHPWGTQ